MAHDVFLIGSLPPPPPSSSSSSSSFWWPRTSAGDPFVGKFLCHSDHQNGFRCRRLTPIAVLTGTKTNQSKKRLSVLMLICLLDESMTFDACCPSCCCQSNLTKMWQECWNVVESAILQWRKNLHLRPFVVSISGRWRWRWEDYCPS